MLQQIFSLSFMTAFLAAAVRLAVPLMYGGIGETIAEKSGILNIGMEGVMLSGAFFSFGRARRAGNGTAHRSSQHADLPGGDIPPSGAWRVDRLCIQPSRESDQTGIRAHDGNS